MQKQLKSASILAFGLLSLVVSTHSYALQIAVPQGKSFEEIRKDSRVLALKYPAVCQIQVRSHKVTKVGTGTGTFFYQKDNVGYVLTAAHVIKDQLKNWNVGREDVTLSVTFGLGKFTVTRPVLRTYFKSTEGTDAVANIPNDLAVLKFDAKDLPKVVTPFPIERVGPPQKFLEAIAIGYGPFLPHYTPTTEGRIAIDAEPPAYAGGVLVNYDPLKLYSSRLMPFEPSARYELPPTNTFAFFPTSRPDFEGDESYYYHAFGVIHNPSVPQVAPVPGDSGGPLLLRISETEYAFAGVMSQVMMSRLADSRAIGRELTVLVNVWVGVTLDTPGGQWIRRVLEKDGKISDASH